MDNAKYIDNTKDIGMDVHKETVTIAVMNSAGKLVVESIIETKAATVLQFIQGLGGNLHVTFEEGTWATWLYELLKPHVTKIAVCDPRSQSLVSRFPTELVSDPGAKRHGRAECPPFPSFLGGLVSLCLAVAPWRSRRGLPCCKPYPARGC